MKDIFTFLNDEEKIKKEVEDFHEWMARDMPFMALERHNGSYKVHIVGLMCTSWLASSSIKYGKDNF